MEKRNIVTCPILLQQGSSISFESVNKITVTKRWSRREVGTGLHSSLPFLSVKVLQISACHSGPTNFQREKFGERYSFVFSEG